MTLTLAERYHDISCGHRVYGHESKCVHLHGHNYRVHFECAAPHGLDTLGRVIDFGAIKTYLCEWLEDHWDHRFLIWYKDPLKSVLRELDPDGIVETPFNPTAENMALYLLNEVGPKLLSNTNVRLVAVRVEETRKCSAYAALSPEVLKREREREQITVGPDHEPEYE